MKYFRCEDPNHFIRECPKPPRDKNQRAFVGGSWSDSGEEDDEKAKDETCLMAQASSKIQENDSVPELKIVVLERITEKILEHPQELVIMYTRGRKKADAEPAPPARDPRDVETIERQASRNIFKNSSSRSYSKTRRQKR
ncbi:hypothetical protein Tco_0224095 [Tanacetum coccineum]